MTRQNSQNIDNILKYLVHYIKNVFSYFKYENYIYIIVYGISDIINKARGKIHVGKTFVVELSSYDIQPDL